MPSPPAAQRHHQNEYAPAHTNDRPETQPGLRPSGGAFPLIQLLPQHPVVTADSAVVLLPAEPRTARRAVRPSPTSLGRQVPRWSSQTLNPDRGVFLSSLLRGCAEWRIRGPSGP